MIRQLFVFFGLYSTIPCERSSLQGPFNDLAKAIADFKEKAREAGREAVEDATAFTKCVGWCNRNSDTCNMDTTGKNTARVLWDRLMKTTKTPDEGWCPMWCKATPSCRAKCVQELQNGDRSDWCNREVICSGDMGNSVPQCAIWQTTLAPTTLATTTTTTTTTTLLQMVDTYIVGGAGGWGGACMCPSGGIYYVGDNNNGCGSIACKNGKQLSCSHSVGKGSQNQVECSVPQKAEDTFQKDAPGAGGWGGACMCPSGGIYFVGDNGDACGSLACGGGEKLWCNKGTGHWSGSKVDCGGGDKPIEYMMPPNKPSSVWGIDEAYKTTSNKVEFGIPTGGWGGECICPNGDSYAVGDNNDACASLNCDGGLKVNCNKQLGPWSNRKVTCQRSSTFNKYFNWEDIKTNIIWSGPSGPSECKAGCDNTDKCKAWEVCPVGPGCNGCYLIGDVSNLQIRPTDGGWFAGLKGDPMFS